LDFCVARLRDWSMEGFVVEVIIRASACGAFRAHGLNI
jgi:hypothetical protein